MWLTVAIVAYVFVWVMIGLNARLEIKGRHTRHGAR